MLNLCKVFLFLVTTNLRRKHSRNLLYGLVFTKVRKVVVDIAFRPTSQVKNFKSSVLEV